MDKLKVMDFYSEWPSNAKTKGLSEITFKRDDVSYSVTDLRFLNPLGVQAFMECLNAAMNVPGATDCFIAYDKDLSEDDIRVLMGITMGFRYVVHKKGKKPESGYYDSGAFIESVTVEKQEDDNWVLKFTLQSNFARHAYEYKQAHEGEPLTIFDLIVFHDKKSMAESDTRHWFSPERKLVVLGKAMKWNG